jgi:large subunit ribosomal protein L21
MSYAIIRIKGKQYKVSQGDEILVDKTEEKAPKCDVLLVVGDKEVKIGKPLVSDAKVILKIVEQVKGKKISVQKFKAKSRYRRKIGFRPQLTKMLVEKITS